MDGRHPKSALTLCMHAPSVPWSAEEAITKYTGFKYAVGFNSCGSALFIALKCLGVEPSDSVLCNASPNAASGQVASAVPCVTLTSGGVVSMTGDKKGFLSYSMKLVRCASVVRMFLAIDAAFCGYIMLCVRHARVGALAEPWREWL